MSNSNDSHDICSSDLACDRTQRWHQTIASAFSDFSFKAWQHVCSSCQLLRLYFAKLDTEKCSLQIINISSTLGSIAKIQGSLDAPEGSLPAMLSHYHLAYRSSKAALNMRKTQLHAQRRTLKIVYEAPPGV